ncbi:MAG: hypothetical protein AAF658_06980 [Myxococcota bacterium]
MKRACWVSAVLLLCGGCDFFQGVKEGFMEGFTESFMTSYRESFVESCVASAKDEAPGLDTNSVEEYCGCFADGLMKKYPSPGELTKESAKLGSSPDRAEELADEFECAPPRFL